MRFRALGMGLALFLLIALTMAAGAVASEGAEGFLSLRVLGLVVDDSGAVRLVPVNRPYAVYSHSGEAVGTLMPGGVLSLPAGAEGTRYTLRADGTPADGFSADDTEHTAVLFPGIEAVCQPILESRKGFFAFAHISAQDGSPVSGGTFALYDEAGAPALTFAAGVDGLYTLPVPLPEGRYTLRMEAAAEGYQYTEETVEIEITAGFSRGEEVPRAALASRPVPGAMYAPDVTAAQLSLTSLFMEEAAVDFTLSLFAGDPPLPLKDVTYAYALPEIAGLRVLAERPDGLSLLLPRRFALDGVEEIVALTITGTVDYTFAYRVSASEEAEVQVQAAFSVTVATFEPLPAWPKYAVTGRVTDAQGAPVADVSALLVDAQGGVLEEVKTDPAGVYAFEKSLDGAHVRLGAPDGYGALWSGNDARILPLTTVSGRVVIHGGLDGTPVALSYGAVGPIAPDADGRFAFTGVFEAGDALTVDVPEGVLTSVVEAEGETIVNLYQPAAMCGGITGPGGVPVAGALVTASAGGVEHTAQTDAQGAWRIEGLLPAEYTVSFGAPEGYVAERSEALAVSVHAGQVVDVAGAGMMPPAAIEGVLTESDMPLAGITVRLEPGERHAVTDATGRFAFEGLYAGEYALAPALPDGMVLLGTPGGIMLGEAGERASVRLEAAAPARLSGRVWHDQNDDGLITSDEPGVAGATVTLLSDQTGDVAAEMLTDKDGQFLFAGMMPGTYRVAVALPDTMIFAREAPGMQRLIVGVDSASGISEPVTLVSGAALDGLTCGAIDAGSIFGRVWQDESGEGESDAGELPVSGVVVEIWRNDALFASAVTDETGAYQFISLRPGEYSLRMWLAEGQVWAASDGESSGVFSSAVSVRRWRPNVEVNAGVQRVGSLSVRVWLDQDADGHDWDEAGYEGLPLALVRVKGGGGQRVAEATTDADGRATFDGLVPGTYRVDSTLPAGWSASAGAERMEGSAARGVPVVIANGASAHTAMGVTALGRIEGIVFADANHDGLRGDVEGGLVATVSLVNPAAGEVLRQTKTDVHGSYRFDGVAAGRYIVRFTLAEGNRFTKNRTDAPSFNSNVPETDGNTAETVTLYLPMGETLRVDAGGYSPASVSGVLWHDADDTGRRPVGGAPLSGVAVSLLEGGETLREMVTDQNGAFLFGGLAPGEYAVGVALPETMRFSLIADGGDSMIQGVGGAVGFTDPFVLSMGGTKADISVGAVYTGTVTGQARDALTGQGIPGAPVLLLRNNIQLGQAVTDADGWFRMEGIRPGEAEVHFTPPTGYTNGQKADSVVAILLEQGGEALCEMEMPPEAAVEGKIWLDAGALDGQEPPLSGALVTLMREKGGAQEKVLQMRSDVNGRFYFGGLPAGEYSLTVQPPDNACLYDGGATAPFAVSMGEVSEHVFSAFLAAQIGGVVWEDVNNNASWDEGEPPLVGVLVALIDASGETVAKAETDEQGHYEMNGLPPLECHIRFAPPEGYLVATASGDGPLRLSMGERLTEMNAGVVRAARIGDLVWLDENGNGLQDTVEPGVAEIKVTLLRVLPDGTMETAEETMTDADGHYRFDGVLPGVFRVVFTLGEEYLPTQRFFGLEQINSKMIWPEGEQDPSTEQFSLPSGAVLLTIDAGIVTRKMAVQFRWIEGEADEVGVIEEEPIPAEATPSPKQTQKPTGSLAPWEMEDDGLTIIDDAARLDDDEHLSIGVPAWMQNGDDTASETADPWGDDLLGDVDPWMTHGP